MKLCFIDLETTGTDPAKNGILQVSGIIRVPRMENVSTEYTFNLRIRPFPTDEIENEALKSNGLDPNVGFTPREAHTELLKVLGRYVDKYNKRDKLFFVGYNAKFDYDFLRRFFDKLHDKYFGSWFFAPALDVMSLALQELIEKRSAMENFKLATVCRTMGIEFDLEKAHGAEYDIAKTAELYDKLVNS